LEVINWFGSKGRKTVDELKRYFPELLNNCISKRIPELAFQTEFGCQLFLLAIVFASPHDYARVEP
jgi:hypothetical protein